MSEQIEISHARRVLSRVTGMRESEFICDFIVKVGEKSFPTHRAVLAASSDYFKALFSSEMKESKQGFIELQALGVEAVEQSLEFMYKGNTQVTFESVDATLRAADLFQLDDLKALCFQYLSQNLSPSNCFTVVNLAKIYDCEDARDITEQYIIANLKLVMSSDMFLLITMSDLLRYISNVEPQTSWQAALTWAKDEEQISQLVEEMDIQKFPFKFLCETVLEESVIKQSEDIKSKVVKRFFAHPEDLRKNLLIDNCVQIKALACDHSVNDQAVAVITQYMSANFQQLAGHPSFNDLSEKDLLWLLTYVEPRFSSETVMVKWKVALKWVKHDLQQRKNAFTDIFRQIKLGMMTLQFLYCHVQNESLVKESIECMGMLVDVLFTKSFEYERSVESAKAQLESQRTTSTFPLYGKRRR